MQLVANNGTQKALLVSSWQTKILSSLLVGAFLSLPLCSLLVALPMVQSGRSQHTRQPFLGSSLLAQFVACVLCIVEEALAQVVVCLVLANDKL